MEEAFGEDMPPARTDILSCDGELLFMRSLVMDKNGIRKNEQRNHLFASHGFLDEDWFQRSYWVFGKNYYGGFGGNSWAAHLYIAGRIMVADEKQVFTSDCRHGRAQTFDYELYCYDRPDSHPEPRSMRYSGSSNKKPPIQWCAKTPVTVCAMVRTADALLVAGPPDLLDEASAFRKSYDPDVQKQIDRQNAAYLGQAGGLLCVLSAADGRELSRHELASPPRFDGMSVARGKVFVVTERGELICLKGE